jgi:hypothetical protein
VIRDSETDSPTTVRYGDVKMVEDNRRNAKMGDLLIGTRERFLPMGTLRAGLCGADKAEADCQTDHRK